MSAIQKQPIRQAVLALCVVAACLLGAPGCGAEPAVERVRVIVTFDSAALPPDIEDGERRRTTIERRDGLLSALPGGKVELLKTMELTGQIVLEVDADMLSTLENAPEVKAVSPDQTYSTQQEQPR